MILRLSGRERYILAVCAVFMLFYIGRNIWTAFNMKQRQRQLEISKAESVIRKYRHTLERNGEVRAKYSAYAARLRQQRSDEEEMSVFLSTIDAEARTGGLYVSDLKPRRIKNNGFYSEFSAGLSLSGEWVPVMQFLQVLQQSPHFLKIVELQIEKDTRPQGALRCRLVLSRILFMSTVE